jgi:glutamine amidotransferase
MIVIIDYGMGNAASIANMIKHIGGEAMISSNPALLKESDNLILPGVGAFDNAIQKLKNLDLYDIIKDRVENGNASLLGICLGMQLLFNKSEEGILPGFGFIEGIVKRFSFNTQSEKLKIPHIGWNDIEVNENNFFRGMEAPRFYFVHSYHPVASNQDDVIAKCRYGYTFDCAIKSKNVIGVQFHPEKSHKFGMQFFKNYLKEIN